jgi:hypothetical protein
LLERLPGLELAAEDVAWQATIDFRGPQSLPVRLRPLQSPVRAPRA